MIIEPVKHNQTFWYVGIFAFWMLIAILYASQSIYSAVNRGDIIEWGRLISWSVTKWMLWAFLTPLVNWLVQRVPVRRISLRKSIVIHLGMGLLVSLLHLLLESGSNYLAWAMAGQPIDFLERFKVLAMYNLHVNLLVYFAIVGAITALKYYQMVQEHEIAAARLQAKLSTARLQALKMQLQPHFLFNTHHGILSMVLKQESETAVEMLTQLSDLLRMTLEQTSGQFTTLKKEIEFQQLYLKIQQTRFKDRLRVKIDLDPRTLKARIPTLILQPLVENAIQHGIAPDSEAGLIKISSYLDGDMVNIRIEDDGPGLPESEDLEMNTGLGMKNTRERLQELFGDSHSFDIINGRDYGTIVTLDVPFIEFPEDHEKAQNE